MPCTNCKEPKTYSKGLCKRCYQRKTIHLRSDTVRSLKHSKTQSTDPESIFTNHRFVEQFLEGDER